MSAAMLPRQVLSGAQVFDGENLLSGHVVVIEAGEIVAVQPDSPDLIGDRVTLSGGTLAPAFLDLQVNGGGGLMVDGSTDLAALQRICAAHISLGCAGILPTLITDTPAATAQVIAAGIAATRAKTPGFLGLHLEGPHLDPRRHGAHDPALIRPMTAQDVAQLCAAAAALPALMLTLAPENASPAQIAALTAAGVVVSLGHSDCSYTVARGAMDAGAHCATHLFNAMSQIGNREPGLVGAVLSQNHAAGLIADGIHVSPAVLQIALAAKASGLFLVSDCMAFAGSDLQEITLNGRLVRRHGGRLTLQDGTLAGADLSLAQAVQVMVETVGIAPARALAMATSIPAQVIGASAQHGHLGAGRLANLVHLDASGQLGAVWHHGARHV
ncbi:N-acetylglucosamine-6-phosphate deacetylase [Cypionkella aquatica]|uniref:N-acetylglucosamine-6-phosphate deacetylase n=1 Tax=Cypionkella aquatica TaxID=1756042 RepID=A0AA37TV33_9RHOB|nr:N-acetylglucosamine-6-phosphate deacetylase [Cypionkella aquatica]GLS86183.1 N-acetylglucosamine-6-phosphate deacetylase [Cypionkella aquatica]